MRQFAAIVFVSLGIVNNAGHFFPVRGRITSQFIGNYLQQRWLLAIKELFEELHDSIFIVTFWTRISI
jgi:hypothetical protein